MNNISRNIDPSITDTFDLVVIGGGITGAGIFYLAAQSGLKTLIIDKNDFASGTSSRSAKLIHGGLRYLQYFQIKLVQEALVEREQLLRAFPHLVKPLAFFMPIYHSWANRLKLSIGLTGYDLLSTNSSMPKHTSISKDEIASKFPMVETGDLKGGFVYYDAKTNDARLVNEVIHEGVKSGGQALNYFELSTFNVNGDSIESIDCFDRISEKNFQIKGKQFISATGIWTDQVLRKFNPWGKRYMKPSKGIHIVVDGKHLPKDHVLILPTTAEDGRFIWCVPWEDGMNVIGSTDTEYSEPITELRSKKEEIDYLLASLNLYVTNKKFTYDDILSTYAGLRPLLDDHEESESTSRPRDYDIWWNNKNFSAIAGGKLTSFLSMAENCLGEIAEKDSEFLYQKKTFSDLNRAAKYATKYGPNQKLVDSITKEKKKNADRIADEYDTTIAEFIFYIRHQNAKTLDDILTRRTLISYKMQHWDETLILKVCHIFIEEGIWKEEIIDHQISDYKLTWQKMHSW